MWSLIWQSVKRTSVGLNAFVVKTVVRDCVSLTTIFRGLIGFIIVDLFVVVLLAAFPRIGLYLPSLLDE